jgi:3-deoxy-D-manno-octulosonate 8-phosphate phosphatase (KDO 8-P phosphatase)
MIEREKAQSIKLLILDVDGVLTDGQIILTEQGEEIKSFSARDGHGIRMLMAEGIEVAIISGRKSKAVDIRADDLGIQEIHLGIKDKGPLCREMIRRKNLSKGEVCCVGDDLPDLPMFEHTGTSFAVADASLPVRRLASHITKRKGGHGAVREVCEILLEARGKWPFGEREN